jgi:hypothetical protein
VSITKTVPVSTPKLVTYANGAAPATFTSIEIVSTIIPKALRKVSSLRALLDITTDEGGTGKVPIDVVDIVLPFIFYPQKLFVFRDSAVTKKFGDFNKYIKNSESFD